MLALDRNFIAVIDGKRTVSLFLVWQVTYKFDTCLPACLPACLPPDLSQFLSFAFGILPEHVANQQMSSPGLTLGFVLL